MELEIIKWLGYVVSGILGWLVRVLWAAQDQMRQDFTKLERDMPLVYVRRDEFKEDLREVKESFKDAVQPILLKLERLEDKLEKDAKEIYKELDKFQRKHP